MKDSVGPALVPPAPDVLDEIRTSMRDRLLVSADRRSSSVTEELVAEPLGVAGLNDGAFYPEDDLPEQARAEGLAPSRAARNRPRIGALRCLVLLVDFPDNEGKRHPSEFEDMLFSRASYPTGSMRDFYEENSYGQLTVTGEVVGWLRLPHRYSHYVGKANGTSANFPHNSQGMVRDALELALKQIDAARFDSDGDGFVDGLFVIHAGGGAEADPVKKRRKKKMWSHQWHLVRRLKRGGVKFYTYFTAPENGRIGVFCHEFGHMLGLPDLYDTTYDSEGVGSWCVMGAGTWLDNGDTPAHFCVWAKARLGWIKPTNVRSSRRLRLNPIETTRRGADYRLWTKGKRGTEYFLLENRQRIGFDKHLPGEGLLIWHIDDTEHNNNHPGDYWVGLKQADGRNDLERQRNQGDTGDPFPGAKDVKKFNSRGVPPAVDQLGNPVPVAVTGIRVVGRDIVCRVDV